MASATQDHHDGDGVEPVTNESLGHSKTASIDDESSKRKELGVEKGHIDQDRGDATDSTDAEPLPTTSKYDRRINSLLTPKNCRWDYKSPKPLTMYLCILYALVSNLTPSARS